MPFLPPAFDWFETLAQADWWGAVAIIAAVAVAVASFFIFRHFNRFGGTITRAVLLSFFVYRIVIMVGYAVQTGNAMDAFPWQLSSLCFLLLPIAVLLNLPRAVKSQIAIASFATGLITLLSMAISPITFADVGSTAILDGLISHAVLTVIPVILLATDEIRFTLKRELPLTVVLFAILVGWGYLANLVLAPGHNVFYLETSLLPFSISGIPVVDYAILLIPSLILFYFFMHFFHRHHDKYRAKRTERLARENVLVRENRKAKRAAHRDVKKKKKEEKRAARASASSFDS